MYKITWDAETGGIQLHSRIVEGTLGLSPRPVFWEELDLLELDELGWKYPHSEEPLLWAINKQYFYRGELCFEAKGANIYDPATIIFQPGKESLSLKPVNVKKMLSRCQEYMFLLESEAIEFINETYNQYAKAKKSIENVAANQLNYEALAKKAEAKTKKKMAIVKEDCDSFEVMPLADAKEQGRKIFQTTKIDKFLASFSGGKDSQVVLDLCVRAIPSTDFEVIYSDTGYELPPSLELYKEVQRHYKALYPDLKFSLTKNHESVINYWDKIGTPSDTHRWCCSIMKTAPLYRMFKIDGTNKQAKVLAYDGVRSEESLRRGAYPRVGKGKHTSVYNAHPILNWNSIEIFLYIFKYKLPINKAYRLGKSRVGCILCPFSTSWDDMIASRVYPIELKPFTERIKAWSKKSDVSQAELFLKERNWKIKAIGDTELLKTQVSFSNKNNDFVAYVQNPLHSIYNWLFAVGDYTVIKKNDIERGTLKFGERLYNFILTYKSKNNTYELTLIDCNDQSLTALIKRAIYKSSYCIHCEVCEVDCPTGALSILPNINIVKSKCIHCHKCLESHDLGCIAADCVRMIKNMNNNVNTKIQGYKTFGLREEWIDEFFADPDYFWKDNTLGTAQIDGFKAWLKDAEIIDSKNVITPLGEFVKQQKDDEYNLLWEVILTNLSYNSFIIKWFANNIKIGQIYDRKMLELAIAEQGYGSSGKTIANAVAALFQTFEHSPIANIFNWCEKSDTKKYIRGEYQEITNAGLAYSLYKYAETRGVRSLKISDFFEDECLSGPYKVLGINKNIFIKTLKSLNSANNRVLIAELNMGLDSITLRDDLDSFGCLKSIIEV